MIKLQNENDLSVLSEKHIHPLICRYLHDYLKQMLLSFRCDDISEYGSIFYLENISDCKQYKFMGLSVPINQLSPDFTAKMVLFGENNADNVTHDISQAVYNVRNRALVIFGEPEVIEPITIQSIKGSENI